MRDFNHTVNVLVKAYLNDTLAHGYCTACAVGNMVADAMGYEFGYNDYTDSLTWLNDGKTLPNPISAGWGKVFFTNCGSQHFLLREYEGEAKRQIDSTGYSPEELAKIERAFEYDTDDDTRDERMFNGLMAVVDVLAEIHNISLEEKQQAKGLFVKV